MTEEDANAPVRLGFAAVGLVLGVVGGWGAFEQFGQTENLVAWLAIGGVVGVVIGLFAPRMLDLLVHLF